jgi:DnaJ-class molecular chaperone
MTAADYTGDSPTCWTCGDDRFVHFIEGGQQWRRGCPDCNPDSQPVPVVQCPKCAGAGYVEDPPFTWAGPDAREVTCPVCVGYGSITPGEAARLERRR